MDKRLLDKPLVPFEIPLGGKLRTDVDPIYLQPGDFQELKNYRHENTGIVGVRGMTATNSVATTYATVGNGYHFKKDQPTEDHIIVQTTSSTNSRLVKVESPTIPSVGDDTTYTAWQTLDNNNDVFFSDAPDNCMVAMNGKKNYVWGGDEYRCAKFINFDPAGSFWQDFTTPVTNAINDANNRATLKRVTGGADASVKGLWTFNADVTDSSGNTNNLTAVNTPTYTAGVFSNALTLDGTNQYAYRATDSDFTYAGTAAEWTLDGRFYFTDLAAIRPIMFQKTDVKKFTYDTGTNAPTVGQVLYGETSGAVIKVLNIVLASGAWDGSGVGTIYYQITSGNIANGEHVHVSASGAGNLIANTTSAEADAGDNYIKISVSTTGVLSLVIYESYEVPAAVVSLSTAVGTIAAATWYYIEVSQSSSNFYIFTGPSAGTATLKATVSDADRGLLYLGNMQYGYDDSTYYKGKIDELRWSSACRHTTDFAVPLAAYASATTTYLYIACTRPIQGVKFYIDTGNATATTSTAAYYWDGDSWATCGALTDTTVNAVDATKVMNKTGTVSFDSTALSPSPKVIREIIAYYYQFAFTGIDDNITVYYCTIDAPLQPIVDIWDNIGRQCASAFLYTTTYSDVTVNLSVADYDSTYALSYANLGTFAAGYSMYFGFQEKCMGINFLVADASYANTTANTVATVYYWTGQAWATVGEIDDGTSVGGKSFAQSGSITWRVVADTAEFQTSVGNKMDLYYYKIILSQTTSSLRIDYVYGITAPKQVLPYRFALNWQNRLWLFNEIDRNRNMGTCSQLGTVCIFNGTGATSLFFGGPEELVAGATVFSRFGASLFDSAVVFKRNEMYLIDGTTPSDFKILTISDSVGCLAPNTLAKCDMAYEVAPGLTKHVLIWQSAGGIQMFDGNSVTKISQDIDDMFDSGKSTYVGNDCSDFSGFFDQVKLEYHWVTTSREMVYHLMLKKWSEIDRGTGKDLQRAFPVMDSNGMQYVYAGTSDGFIQRLEYGTTFDGNAVVYTFRLGDIALSKSTMYESIIRHLKFIGVVKSSAQTITITWYGDGDTTGTTVVAVSQVLSGKRIYQVSRSVALHAVFHSIKCSISTTTETIGSEPLVISGFMKPIREDIL